MSPEEFRAAGPVGDAAVAEFLRFYANACTRRGVTPLIENVPPVLRMRTGGVYVSDYPNYFEQVNNRLEDVWQGKTEPKAALDAAQAAIEAEEAKPK